MNYVPPAGLIHIRFDLICNSSRDHDQTSICRVNSPVVPRMGETVSLDGQPYIVKDVGWAFLNDDKGGYAYVRVSKLYEF